MFLVQTSPRLNWARNPTSAFHCCTRAHPRSASHNVRTDGFHADAFRKEEGDGSKLLEVRWIRCAKRHGGGVSAFGGRWAGPERSPDVPDDDASHDGFAQVRARRGSKKAILAIAADMLRAAYFILKRAVPNQDFGADFYDRLDHTKAATFLVKRLRNLGYKVSLSPAS